MSSHAGQPAFPGGAVDDTDAGVVAAALREAEEETGLDPSGVDVFATLPALWLPPSGFVVTPVLGWWRDPSPVGVVDPGEVESVVRVPLSELLDPANRCPCATRRGSSARPSTCAGMLVWGFTAGMLSRLLALAGWERPWDASVERAAGDLVNIVDAVLVVVAVLAVVSGWRQGLVSGVLSFVGFIGGALVGALVAPRLLGHISGLVALALAIASW